MGKVAVLRYGNISPEDTPTEITFEKQINWLIENNTRIITLSELESYINGNLRLENAALIAVTSAHLDSWVWINPILEKYNVPAVCFIDSWEIEEDEFAGFSSKDIPKIDYRRLRRLTAPIKTIFEEKTIIKRARLSWFEVRTMSNKNFLCQSAGKFNRKGFIDSKIDGFITTESHPLDADDRLGAMHFKEGSLLANRAFIPDRKINDLLHKYLLANGYTRFFEKENWQDELKRLLPDAPYGRFETDEQYRLRVRNRLLAAKGELQTEIKHNVYALFWPFGEYSSESIKIAQSTGFRLFFTKKPGFVETGCQNEIPTFSAKTLSELKAIYV